MKVEIKDEKLIKILEKRGELLKDILAQNELKDSIEKEMTKLGYKMNDLKEKTKIIVDKLEIDKTLKEFEFVAKVYMEEGKAYYEVQNQVEEYKNALREEAKKEEKKDEDTTDK